MPTEFLPNSIAATQVVPEPTNGSSTQSPSLVKSLMNHAGSSFGYAALCPLLLHSEARCSTFVGYTNSLPTQLETFLPNPLPTLELSRALSVSLRFLRRVLAQSPIGTITASWYMSNFFSLLNWRHRSQASRKRFGHLPG